MLTTYIEEYGPKSVVHLSEAERPVPRAGEVLVRVLAAGVNPVDWKIRSGAGARMGMTLPIRLGSEYVGIVEQTGEGVTNFSAGDEVFGMVKTGAFSEYLTVPAVDIARKPEGLGLKEAAALPLAGTTAWQAMVDEAGLVEGQRLLITGASGGVGTLAVQLAKAAGAHVTALCSTRNIDLVRGLGADEVVDYTACRFEDFVHDMDVVFDTVGAETFQRAFATLRRGGVMVTVVAFPEGDEAARYGVTVKRSFTASNAETLGRIGALAEAGKLVPRIERTFGLSEVKDALELSENGRARGKIVLTM
ncbi:NADPH:quinone reductase [Thioclava sp. SK-1]|uniref:NADP-dependent oxidoreductase n=1 Tax=Thioclava sp. SK-1 TaxID=1889770 RepID=UPI000824ED83|nr:NADP-dependent oxidoreductase [Thioclava sp. SK-1]OCX61729.1 NADPH:quinone reductase [Thioclava sp. SK-1]